MVLPLGGTLPFLRMKHPESEPSVLGKAALGSFFVPRIMTSLR